MFVYDDILSPNDTNVIFDLDSNTHRHSLYEPPPAHSVPKVKRTETIHTIHSAGTNHTTSKGTSSKDRHLSREG